MPAEHPSRWEYRFDNFSRALALLREAAEDDPSRLSDLEREGLVQRFEYTFELAWKTLKDRLEHDGLQVSTVTPRNVIRAAFSARMIDAADDWIDMLTDRNRMSHEYDFAVFEEVANRIHVRYLGLFEAVHDSLGRVEDEPMSTSQPVSGRNPLSPALLDRLTRLFEAYPELAEVVLFGSRATGSASPRSDIDLATRGIRDTHRLGRLALDLEDLDIPQTCDVKAIEDIRYAPLRHHIASVGITIYSR